MFVPSGLPRGLLKIVEPDPSELYAGTGDGRSPAKGSDDSTRILLRVDDTAGLK